MPIGRQVTIDIDVAEVTLVARVQAIAAQTDHRYGSRRIVKPLQVEGSAVGRCMAPRVMQEAGIYGWRCQHCPVTTDSRHSDAVAPSLLARPCDVAPPDTVWVGDMTEEHMRGWFAWINRRQVPAYQELLRLFDFLTRWHGVPFDEQAASEL